MESASTASRNSSLSRLAPPISSRDVEVRSGITTSFRTESITSNAICACVETVLHTLEHMEESIRKTVSIPFDQALVVQRDTLACCARTISCSVRGSNPSKAMLRLVVCEKISALLVKTRVTVPKEVPLMQVANMAVMVPRKVCLGSYESENREEWKTVAIVLLKLQVRQLKNIIRTSNFWQNKVMENSYLNVTTNSMFGQYLTHSQMKI